MQDADLDDLFLQMQDAGPVPSGRLMARIEADALAEQDCRSVAALARARPTVQPAQSRWAGLFGGLGGRGVLAGLGCATLAGVWLGLVQPTPVATLSDTLANAFGTDAASDQVEMLPVLDSFVLEG